eukprot:803831-Pleurochrysis_carterae.AAC.1
MLWTYTSESLRRCDRSSDHPHEQAHSPDLQLTLISSSLPVLAVRTPLTKRTGIGASRLCGVLGTTSASRASMLRLSY